MKIEIKNESGTVLFGGDYPDIKRAVLAAVRAGADLRDANLSNANLSDANLSGAELIGANLIDADLSGANLIDANLRNADLSGAELLAAKMSGAKMIGANLIGAQLIRADLHGADLSRANLIGANLRDANLSNANLSGANLHGADLHGANRNGADVCGSTLGSKGYGVAVTDAPKETLAEKAKRLLDKSFLTDTELARARSELSGLHNQVTNAQNRCTALAVDSKMLALAAGDAYDQYRASLALSPTQAEVSA
jgi:hypothetical protein